MMPPQFGLKTMAELMGLVQLAADKSNPLHEGLTNPVSGLEGARGYSGGGSIRAYHGSTAGPVRPGERFNFPGNSSEKGVFFTPDARAASQYGGYSPAAKNFQERQEPGGKIFPVNIDAKNSATIDLKAISGKPQHYQTKIVQTAIDAARAANKDFVVIRNMNDLGGTPEQIIAIRPAGKVSSAITGETLFGLMGAGLLGSNLIPDENQK